MTSFFPWLANLNIKRNVTSMFVNKKYRYSLMTGPGGNSSFCFPRISVFSPAAPRGNIEILGKQNELFPSGPVIKCLLFGDQTFYHLATLFGAVWSCLVVFDKIWKAIKQLKTLLLFSCLIGELLFVWPAVSNMFGAPMRSTLAQPLVSTCFFLHICTHSSKCFNHLATHFNISMFISNAR